MNLLYFAWVRQKIGKSEEVLDLAENMITVRALVECLRSRGGGYADAFADPARLRVAVNQRHVSFDMVVSPNDEVAFFPPVTGG